MTIKLKLISTIFIAFMLTIIYLAFFTLKIKRIEVSKPISLETLLQNEM